MSDTPQDIAFHSKDIAKKPSPDYFVRVKKSPQKTSPKLSEFLFHGHRKFITIGIAVLVLATVVTIPIIINIQNSLTSKLSGLSDTERRTLIDETFEEFGAHAGITKFQEFIDATSDNSQKALIHLERANALFGRFNDVFATQILSDVHAAESLSPTFTTASMVYTYERLLGNDDTIVQEFLQIMEERRPADINTDGPGIG